MKISKNSSAQELMEIEKDKYNVSWNLADASAVEATAPKLDESKFNSEIDETVDNEINKEAVLMEVVVQVSLVQKQAILEAGA